MSNVSLFLPGMVQLKKRRKPVRVAGIDLGTTNSSITEIIWTPETAGTLQAACATVEQKLPGKGDEAYTDTLVPSEVALWDGEVYVGRGAKMLRAESLHRGLVRNKNFFYECKNDIGLRKTYSLAPEGFRSASEIQGRILAFLHTALCAEDPARVSRAVITVPSSFQSAQRSDTLRAAALAGLNPKHVDLLDEPVAAFLDYLTSHRDCLRQDSHEPKNLLVFDFGGGTCDVAVLSLSTAQSGFQVNVCPRAVSRYHRLGGGDIDRAIVYELLIPKLLSVNNLSRFDLSYEDKHEYLEPVLLELAEQLKIQLCDHITAMKQRGAYDGADRNSIVSIQPGIFTFSVKGLTLMLNCPQLSAQEFETILAPFLDDDLLYARETEYRMVCSVFAPLQDALDRSRLAPPDIDYCLLLGGSCSIPQVSERLQQFLPHARLLTFADRQSLQTAVARGAAFQALCLELFGRGIIRPVCYDRIFLCVDSGTLELVPDGAELPYPSNGSPRRLNALAVPKTVLSGSVELKVELVAGQEKRSLYRALWCLPGPVNKGDPLYVEYRFNENQVLDITLVLEGTGEKFSAVIESPLTSTINPQERMVKILELEEDIRTGALTGESVPEAMVKIGENYSELGYKEKAVHTLKQALKVKGGPDGGILNRLGNYYMDMGDHERAEKFYYEAVSATSWSGPSFNLALSQRRRQLYEKAAATIDAAIAKDRQAPYLVLKALISSAQGDAHACTQLLQEAFLLFKPVRELSDWELGWYITAADKSSDRTGAAAARDEQQKRLNDSADDFPDRLLPVFRSGLARTIYTTAQ